MPVRLLLAHVAVSYRPAAAGSIHHGNRDAQELCDSVGEIAGGHVGGTAGSEHDRHFDGPAPGILIRMGRCG
jgi:hypothetical protein